MFRREFLLIGAGAALAITGYRVGNARMNNAVDPSSTGSIEGDFEFVKSEEEWRSILSEDQFSVLREKATERAFTSPLNSEKRDGTYHCVGCDNALYESETKFDSGTGWPSFYQSLPGAVGTSADNSLIISRTEVHCKHCGGHLGHVFDDGPEPTGKRHCINGIALNFKLA